ncbi:ketopantoate reductase family protein [Carboxylicivirga marina]|uniref:ketopantoate reductase family protein n=1 Tax=Carboxylicivirga marina TaxID=2800988 RepID=UPI002594A7B5|nr:2-dehydropantoate 2-reductase [uncultured Carboxylicivirga sp.]
MKILVVGTGGVGGYFGARLAQAGNDVTFIARGNHLEAIRENGLLVKSINGDVCIKNAHAVDAISDIKHPDLVLTAVKAWQIKEIREEIAQVIHDESIVLPLQNGVLAAKELAEVIPAKNVMGGLCRIFSMIEAPGVINHVGYKPEIVFGEPAGSSSMRTQKLSQLFEQANISYKSSNDIEADVWKKFIFICTSALLAVTKTTYGELRELKETRSMMIGLLNEIYAVSQKAGVNIKAEFIDKTIAVIDSVAYDSTSSLTRDVWEGKPSEIEYQNGTVVKLAEEYGVEVPVNRFVYHVILPMELKTRSLKGNA